MLRSRGPCFLVLSGASCGAGVTLYLQGRGRGPDGPHN